ncbi:MAG: HNH nuclease family protein [Hahellaceae bacterium]|jgi:hypothetical protein|nr:HNH nuclease family protein [Hahellaceae bacterium]
MSKENNRAESSAENTYRDRALKMYPWVCGRCAREFTYKNLSELTVHHKDHNHGNNPPDGSNWELLCLYCHDYEHAKVLESKHLESQPGGKKIAPATFKPFSGLEDLLKKTKKETD